MCVWGGHGGRKPMEKYITACQIFRIFFFIITTLLTPISTIFFKTASKEYSDVAECVQTSPNPIDVLQCQTDLYPR